MTQDENEKVLDAGAGGAADASALVPGSEGQTGDSAAEAQPPAGGGGGGAGGGGGTDHGGPPPGHMMKRKLPSAILKNPAAMLKETVQEKRQYQVDGTRFCALSSAEITRFSELEVTNVINAQHLANSPMDQRLGNCDGKRALCSACNRLHPLCATCGRCKDDCVGHFGHVRLVLPVFHVGFLKATLTVLQCICKTCGRALLEEAQHKRFLNAIRRPTIDDLQRDILYKKVIARCKKPQKCPYCEAQNASVKKDPGASPLFFRHDLGHVGATKSSGEASRVFQSTFDEVRGSSRLGAAGVTLERAAEDLTPLAVFRLLHQMTPEDREILGTVQPERMLITAVPVPPVCIRPVVMGDRPRDDDLTSCIEHIVQANKCLHQKLLEGGKPELVYDAWDLLQNCCSVFINSEASGLKPFRTVSERKVRSLCTRLKGKEGRFRGNLSAKRVDFSARTVISPDPNLSVEEVAVPEWVAKRMTFPEKVCQANIARLRAAVVRGPNEHPGACKIIYKGGWSEKFLWAHMKNFRLKMAEGLKFGDTVERHMRDGDVVIFNRQPSLHRLSMMAHSAKVMPGRTFRFNECVCGPYGADFDGDEMNLHLPQTEEARAECLHLMGVREGLVSPKSGEAVICAIQDFLTGAHLLTQKDVFLSRDKFCQLCTNLADGFEAIDLPPPAIMKPCELWTGKQAIGVLLRPNRHSKVLVNLEIPERNYSKKEVEAKRKEHGLYHESMCRSDGWVFFRNSELVSGSLGKKVLGGAKDGIFFRLIQDSGAKAAIGVMCRLAKLTSRFLMNRGFTIGIDDVNENYGKALAVKATDKLVSHRLGVVGVREQKLGLLQKARLAVDQKIETHQGSLLLRADPNADKILEAEVKGELDNVRNLVGDMCLERVAFWNKPRIMVYCGSKGSPDNLAQMMGCVGQQNVLGKRIKTGFVNRTLPHFTKTNVEPAAYGFVQNSFYSGLTPTEFFFHMMAGREGLVDTAVKTASSGYIQRKLIKALEDLSLKYDFTVRTSAGDVVQFAISKDGLDPTRMETSSTKPIDFKYMMRHVQSVMRPPVPFVTSAAGPKRRRLAEDTADSRPLMPADLRKLVRQCEQRFFARVSRARGSAEVDLSQVQSDLGKYLVGLSDELAKRLQLEPQEGSASSALGDTSTALPTGNALADVGCPTKAQLFAFVERCADKYVHAMLMPGEAVGAVAAQSIGEPMTQMTLKTFHFAGLASMNVTLGVPRIQEIINAAQNISTPIITCALHDARSKANAALVKGRIEKTTLGEICRYIKEVYDPGQGCYISVKVDVETIKKLQLNLTMAGIKEALLRPKNLREIRLTAQDVEIINDKLRVRPPRGGRNNKVFFSLQALKKNLPDAVVCGLSFASSAKVDQVDRKAPPADASYHILVSGTGLRQVMNVKGVDPSRTVSNHVTEVARVLGIEAARKTIMLEIGKTIEPYKIALDSRHIGLLGDCMTYKGRVLGINDHGMKQMTSSTFRHASFERTNDALFDAAFRQKADPVKGVSERILLGHPVNLGTGLFKLLYDFTPPSSAVPSAGAVPAAASARSGGASSASTHAAGAGAASLATEASSPAQRAQRAPLMSAWKRARQQPA